MAHNLAQRMEAQERAHGTTSGYTAWGCRLGDACPGKQKEAGISCTEAMRNYQRARNQKPAPVVAVAEVTKPKRVRKPKETVSVVETTQDGENTASEPEVSTALAEAEEIVDATLLAEADALRDMAEIGF